MTFAEWYYWELPNIFRRWKNNFKVIVVYQIKGKIFRIKLLFDKPFRQWMWTDKMWRKLHLNESFEYRDKKIYRLQDDVIYTLQEIRKL